MDLERAGRISPCIAAPEGEVTAASRRAGLSVLDLPYFSLEKRCLLRRPLRTVLALERVARAIANHLSSTDTRLVHANGQKALLPALWAARLAGVPCLWHVRECPERAWLLRKVVKGVSVAVVPSAFMKEAVHARLGMPDEWVHCVPNGVQPPDAGGMCPGETRRQLSLSENAFLIAMVAQLAPWKRHEVAIEAARLLREAGVPAELLIAGDDLSGQDGGYRKRLTTAAEGIAEHVHFLGFRQDIAGVLAASDVLVLPSVQEPFGRVIVEAWRCHRPVIVADNGALAEIVDDGRTGLHFKTDDAKDLAAALWRFWENPSFRARLAEAGRHEAEQYTIKAHAAEITALYERVIMCE